MDLKLAGLMLIIGSAMSHSGIEGIVWLSICMPTGSGKSKFLKGLVRKSREQSGEHDGPFWQADDQSFEKLGEQMETNH